MAVQINNNTKCTVKANPTRNGIFFIFVIPKWLIQYFGDTFQIKAKIFTSIAS